MLKMEPGYRAFEVYQVETEFNELQGHDPPLNQAVHVIKYGETQYCKLVDTWK